MDIDQQRLQDDLRGSVRGDVLVDPLSLQLYSSDASIYQIPPLAVVRPRSASDIVATIQYASENALPIHARGSGSGVSGESLGRGIILDMSRYLNRIRMDEDDSLVTVQSGVILADLNRMAKKQGRWYGPDPATRGITTMGSVIATNASGSHFLRSGRARRTIQSLRVVTVDGELLELSTHDVQDDGTAGRLARGVGEIHMQFRDSIRHFSESHLLTGGYQLDGVIDQNKRIDLAKFMAGSQGTLATIVDATVRLEPIPAHRGVILLFFHRLDDASRCAVKALTHGPVACDLMDRRLLQIARETEPRFAGMLPRQAEAMLLVELQGESLEDLNDRVAVAKNDLTRGTDGAFESIATVDEHDRNLYWALSRRVIPRLSRVRGSQAPLPFIDDLSVPTDRLPEVVTAIQDTLKKNETTATIFAHAGHGQLNVRPFLNLADAADREKLQTLSDQFAQVVWDHDGQVSVAHASGLSRSYLLPRQYGDLWQAIGQVKRLFDPQHRLNPGKLFGAIMQRPNENLRPANQTIEVASEQRILQQADESTKKVYRQSRKSLPQLQVLQTWPAGKSVSDATRACNGCGRCRASTSGERQCPMFRAFPREEASPRAKANLLRGVLSGNVKVDELTTDRSKEIADLCFNCHQCRVECPASVDIPKIAGELKAQYVATNGLSLSDYLISRVDGVSAIASRLAIVSNFLIRNGASRWLAERLFGLTAGRQLPPVVSNTFLRIASRRRWTKSISQSRTKVVYFVDHYANYHDPSIGLALAEILQQNGIAFYVPTAQNNSGMARITAGDLKGARRLARRNVRLLADSVRKGYTVVATEPAAALCLQYEYPNLMDDEDAHLVAENSMEACQFLWDLHQRDKLNLEFNPIAANVAYHQPCHLRALDSDPKGPKLMSLIPRFDVQQIEAGCSGMAGTWGLQRKNYRNSLRIGWPMISAMRAAPVSLATTECSACKMQIEHGAGWDTIHPLKVLAYAYGRMPSLADQLGPKSNPDS